MSVSHSIELRSVSCKISKFGANLTQKRLFSEIFGNHIRQLCIFCNRSRMTVKSSEPNSKSGRQVASKI